MSVGVLEQSDGWMDCVFAVIKHRAGGVSHCSVFLFFFLFVFHRLASSTALAQMRQLQFTVTIASGLFDQ